MNERIIKCWRSRIFVSLQWLKEIFFKSRKFSFLNAALLSQEINFTNTFNKAPILSIWYKRCHSGVNFINFKLANFTYECHFSSIFSSYMYVKKASETTFIQKICTYNVDEIDGRITYKNVTNFILEPNLNLQAEKVLIKWWWNWPKVEFKTVFRC